MPLYEILLRFADRDELRLTDRPGDRPGEEMLIDGRRFRVVGREPAQASGAESRLVLVPSDERASRTTFAQTAPTS